MWQKPAFEPTVLIIISLLVVMISVPIHVVVRKLMGILTAPTDQEINKKIVVTKNRRQSAVSHLNLSEAQLSGAHAKRASKRFTRITELNLDLAEKHRNTQVFRDSMSKSSKAGVAAEQQKTVYDFRSMLAALSAHDGRLSGRERQRFRSQWGMASSAARVLGDPNGLRKELESVQQAAAEELKKLEGQAPSHIGVEILRLFALDLVGRGSRKARVFENQLEALGTQFVVSWGLKCLVVSVSSLLPRRQEKLLPYNMTILFFQYIFEKMMSFKICIMICRW